MSTLKIEESGLKAAVLQLDADHAQLQRKKVTLQEEIRGLQPGVDLAREHKAKGFEQGQIAFILDQFANDIKSVDSKKHGKAKEVAEILHKTLHEHAQNYYRDQNKEVFIENCRASIDQVTPELNDLGWGRKLQNLLIALWNVIMPQSSQSNFFKTKLTEKAEKVSVDIENVKKINPQ